MRDMLQRLAQAVGLAKPKPPETAPSANLSGNLLGDLAQNSGDAIEYKDDGKASSMPPIAPRDPSISLARLEAEPARPQTASGSDAPTNSEARVASPQKAGGPSWDSLRGDTW